MALTITAAEEKGYPQVGGDPLGAWGKRCIRVRWADIDSALDQLMTTSAHWPYGNIDLWFYNFRVIPAESGMTGTGGELGSYNQALMFLEYRTMKEVGGIRMSVELEPVLTPYKLDEKALFWNPGPPVSGLVSPDLVYAVMGSEIIRVTYHHIPALPPEVITLAGTCNRDPYTVGVLGSDCTFLPETLRFNGAPAKFAITAGGLVYWTVTFELQYRPVRWNYGYRTATNSWGPMYNSSGTEIKPITPAPWTI